MYGAQQGQLHFGDASASAEGSIDRPDWFDVGVAESGYIAPAPTDPEIVYAGLTAVRSRAKITAPAKSRR